MFSVDSDASSVALLSPIENCIETSTLMQSPVVCNVPVYFRVPFKCNRRQVAMAHNGLTKVINTMIYLRV